MAIRTFILFLWMLFVMAAVLGLVTALENVFGWSFNYWKTQTFVFLAIILGAYSISE